MRDVQQVFWGIFTALLSTALLFGGFSLSLAEGNMRLPTPTLTPTTTLTSQSSPSLVDSPTPLSPAWTPTLPPAWTPTLPPTRTPTLPPTRNPTLPPPPTKCAPPPGWLPYIVLQGDTLYHLGQVYGIPFTDIQRANCLTSSNIHIGQRLYVPPWATRTPSPTSILPSDTPSVPWFDTPTETLITETSTPTDTETASATPTPTPPTETANP